MSLYGALYAGVAGLQAQSNKLGIISDNIANVNTVGYKEGSASFETLVVNSGTTGAYSPGGVLGGNQQLISTQGLLQTTSSATDIAVSGSGFFVVNQGADGKGQVLYTRAGSFTPDSTGNFKNASGFFLQAWPLDRSGNLPGAPGNLNTTSSANLSSLQTVNVQNLTGTAAASSTVSLSANLKSTQVAFAGAAGIAKMDNSDTINTGIAAKDIIVPSSVNSTARGDKFSITSGAGLSYSYSYGGFAIGRNVVSSAVGDSGAIATSSTPVTLNPAPATITPAAVTLNSAATTLSNAASIASGTAGTSGLNSVVVTLPAPNLAMKTNDYITFAGMTAGSFLDTNIPAAQVNGQHQITVIDSTHYSFTTIASGATGGVSDATTGSSLTSTADPIRTGTTVAGHTPVNISQTPPVGLVVGDYVTISGLSGAVDGLALNTNSFKITSIAPDGNHYTIDVLGAASLGNVAGGSGAVITPAPFSTSLLSSGTLSVAAAPPTGLQVGDAVTLAGISPATLNGLTLNGSYKIASIAADGLHYTLATGGTTSATGGAGTTSFTAANAPFVTTSGSPIVTLYEPNHKLVTGDVITLANLPAGGVGGIAAANLTGSFVVTKIDADRYQITALADATATAGGGAGTTVLSRPFVGNILDASNATQPLLGTTGTTGFTKAALSFSITTAATGTVKFTYTSSSPNAQLGQFNSLNNLASAINSVNGLSARVVNDRLYVGATDANAAVTFANGSAAGVSGPPVQSGIDWVSELGVSNVTGSTNRFSTLEGLAALVNASSGLTATVENALASADVRINGNDPLDTITFSDRPISPADAPLPSVVPFYTTSGSKTVTINQPAHGFSNGDIITLSTSGMTVPGGETYNGIPITDFNGQFVISNVTSSSYTINVPTAATATGTDTTPTSGTFGGLLVTPPNNSGSLLSSLGLTPSLSGGSFVPKNTGALGPSYDPTNSIKDMASGAIPAQFSRPITVYDGLGTSHNLNAGFLKTGQNTWAVEIYSQPASDVSGSAANGQIAYGSLTFNGDGSLRSVSASLSQPVNINWTNGATPSAITFSWGTAGQPFGTANATTIGKTDGLSQFDSDYNVNFVNQNGAPVGQLTGVSIDASGFITASYNNGETQKLYKIPLAEFTDANQLQTVSGNAFEQSASSGEVNLRQAGTSGVGTLASGSLEASNVELANQLTDMIVAQRAYQANTKVISTADQLLNALDQIIQ